MKFLEIEFKYSAKNISLSKFHTWAKTNSPKSYKAPSSNDYYYVKNDTAAFIRYRTGDRPELTMKVKKTNKNNYVRIEFNLKLDPKDSPNNQKATVDGICGLLGFSPNFVIFKSCHIYYWDLFNVVHYTVFDEKGRDKGSFIEIEMKEDFNWESEAQAWAKLKEVEQSMKSIGIVPNKRIPRSLFEMFRK